MSLILGALEEGLAFSAGTRQAVAAGGTASLHIENPTASGRVLYIAGFSVYTGETARVQISYFKDATSSGSAVSVVNHNFGSVVSPVSVVKAGGNVLTGGTELSPRSGATARAPFSFVSGILFAIPPGCSAALLSQRPAGLSGTEDVDINVHWVEVPIE